MFALAVEMPRQPANVPIATGISILVRRALVFFEVFAISNSVLTKANLSKGRDAKLPVYGLGLGQRGCRRQKGISAPICNPLGQFLS